MTIKYEEQLAYDTDMKLIFGVGAYREGQRLTISSRTVQSLHFFLKKTGSNTTQYYFRIRKVSNDSVIWSILKGTMANMGLTTSYQEISHSGVNTLINEEVRISVEADSGGGQDTNNCIILGRQNADVKASEIMTYYTGSYTDGPGDMAYRYGYDAVPITYPTDPITRVSGIVRTFYAGAGGEAMYQQQNFCGGVSPTYVPPLAPRAIQGVEPPQYQTSNDAQAYAKSGLGYQQEDYVKWLLSQSKGTGPTVGNPYSYVMTYEQWLNMMGRPPRNGWPGFGIR